MYERSCEATITSQFQFQWQKQTPALMNPFGIFQRLSLILQTQALMNSFGIFQRLSLTVNHHFLYTVTSLTR